MIARHVIVLLLLVCTLHTVLSFFGGEKKEKKKELAKESIDGSNEALGDGEEVVSTLLDAVSRGDHEGMRYAVEHGEDINTVNINGWTAASFAVASGDLDALRFLIAAGIDLNIGNSDGYTPLMLAALQSDKELVEVLLEHNADPLVATENGVTASKIAEDSKRLIVAATILEACVIRGKSGWLGVYILVYVYLV